MYPLSGRGLHPNWGVFVQIFSSATSIVALATLPEQSELRRIARGFGDAEMAERMRGQQPPARRALQIAALNQERLDDILDGIARLRQRRRHGLHADRAAALIPRGGVENPASRAGKAAGALSRRARRFVGNGASDRGATRRR